MPTHPPPRVHIEEAAGPRPIEAVGTSTAAFFGVAPNAAAALRQPTMLVTYPDFQHIYSSTAPANSVLATAVAGFFANGGSRCHVVNLGANAVAVTPADLQLLDIVDGINIVAAPGFTDASSHDALVSDCERRGDRFAILDTPKLIEPLSRLTRQRSDGDGLRPRSSGMAAVYVPWLLTADAVTGETVEQPPSAHVAGVYARTDAERGVFKAPANVALRDIVGLTRAISARDQEILNPVGVNCIRTFADGIKVWGARTLADVNEWRYVPVRRLATMIVTSIERGTRWAMFEPNDLMLWNAIRREIEAFLFTLWRNGAFAGTRANEAYFVKCDAETTRQTDIDAGHVITLIGIAPLRPAEFIVLRISQATSQRSI